MVTEVFAAAVNCWPPAATSLSHSTVVLPCLHAEVWFCRGTWWAPLYFNCMIQQELGSPLRKWHLRNTCLCLKEGEKSASCPEDSWTIQTQLEQQISTDAAAATSALLLLQLCPSWVFSYTGRQIKSPLIHSPSMKNYDHPAPQKIFCFQNTICSSVKHCQQGKWEPRALKWIPRFFLLYHYHACWSQKQ